MIRHLPIPEGYDPGTSPVLSTMAAQLDAQLAALFARVRDAPAAHLEWQIRPGTNTIGMLLAHLAVCEVFWVEVVGRGIESETEAARIVHEVVGVRIADDGMPLAGDGVHPPSLAGKSAADYLEMLERARAATHRTLRSWDDRDLETTRRVDGREVTLAWLLHHIVEHFSHHAGQIAQIASLRRLVEGE